MRINHELGRTSSELLDKYFPYLHLSENSIWNKINKHETSFCPTVICRLIHKNIAHNIYLFNVARLQVAIAHNVFNIIKIQTKCEMKYFRLEGIDVYISLISFFFSSYSRNSSNANKNINRQRSCAMHVTEIIG